MPLYSLRFVLIRLDPIQQVWGVTVGTAIIQTQLTHRLSPQFLSQIPGAGSVALAYSAIPIVPTLAEPLKGKVQDAFARSISVIWLVLMGISGAGLLSTLLMKEVPLHKEVDKQWGMEEKGSRISTHHENAKLDIDTIAKAP